MILILRENNSMYMHTLNGKDIHYNTGRIRGQLYFPLGVFLFIIHMNFIMRGK